MKDYYKILNINRGGSSRKIYIKFKELAFPLHPEKRIREFEKDKELFLDYCEAYYVLNSKANRRLYQSALEKKDQKESDEKDLKELKQIIRSGKKEAQKYSEMPFKEFKKALPRTQGIILVIIEILLELLNVAN